MKIQIEEYKDQIVDYVTVERIKKCLIRRYERVTESKWTRYFIITSIIQTIFAIVFIARVLDRNNRAANRFNNESQDIKDYRCKTINSDRIQNIIGENTVFLIFNIFQLWFCQNAIFNQNTIQIINIAVINYLCALFAIVQIVEIDIWTKNANNCLPGFDYHAIIAAYEVPLIVIVVICATLQVFFTWKLYQQFGWNIYKKIGADLRMQRIYRTMLIFVMLLKIDLFFMNYLAIEGCIVTRPGRSNQNLSEGLYYFHVCITIIIVFLQLLVWHSLRKESSLGMKIFIGAWIVCIADFIILLVDSIKPSSEESWYFFTSFIAVGIIMGLVTLLWSIFLLRNFGKGLKPHLSRQSHLETLPTQQTSNPTDSSTPQRIGRWAIDD
ncbi:hypothetical protein RhiirA5_411615 [Rhizophagus irregularis]|uniref:Transmembrane protein n=3 Tax=Rhizophagus irregularis TaxID=588596 RepID=A0A2I1DUW2_9GLOM|nr:hypothetical protein GLOIN_2v1704267 [Rhizophagus irregularis DAOM 181602=DAOM 197198]PKC12595.1 hypothetical protein RhiirA5_411615 [Rhizophagus irregularis]PKC76381.1 hypothetical protein RhiirA1_447679 [Rhizophagus irregularis]PKY13644.1 hypothetical protein RhiirB3_425510 [Rhizophagus irregularis]POG61399.1 hypothetical protein GLOIN_2v1704267 [Rhizophagus irregularis DAOM 181602=DAOM 197198]UZO27681.1 hypothetical protein OCT59_019871 [Rhizophagus irregularis]|eukprot:XP_025168265.1 hypothetical protein GLOIN_2v1704267 [Rhizophagus irregularis DAOM 181602=DAOM 197198]